MPTTYTITVKNKSGTERDYFLFIEKPKLNTGERFYHNVYMTAPGVDSYSGRAIFTCHTNYYAVCGTSPRALDANVRVDTADSAPVRLSQGTGSPGTHLYMSGGLKPDGSGGTSARFVNSETKNDCTEPGAFQIDCHDFKANNGSNHFIGCGIQDPKDEGNVVPISVTPAVPGDRNYIRPHVKYYVAWGQYQQGQIIDVATIAKPAEIDFTGKNNSKATVVHNMDGTWTVTLSSPG